MFPDVTTPGGIKIKRRDVIFYKVSSSGVDSDTYPGELVDVIPAQPLVKGSILRQARRKGEIAGMPIDNPFTLYIWVFENPNSSVVHAL